MSGITHSLIDRGVLVAFSDYNTCIMQQTLSTEAEEIKRNADRKYHSTCKRPFDYENIGELYAKSGMLYKSVKKCANTLSFTDMIR